MPAIGNDSHWATASNGSEALQRWLRQLPATAIEGGLDGGGFVPSSSSSSPPPPRIESLIASSAEELGDLAAAFDTFDEDDNLLGSSLAFDASAGGLWQGRFVPPPPRPPFFVDEPLLHDGLTTCDLCSWAMPAKSTFIFEGTIEKASELGWPLTLIIVSMLSAVVGAIVMITVVRCRRRKTANNRNGKCAKGEENKEEEQEGSKKQSAQLPPPPLSPPPLASHRYQLHDQTHLTHHHQSHQSHQSHQQQPSHHHDRQHPLDPLDRLPSQRLCARSSCSSSSLTIVSGDSDSVSTNQTSLSTICHTPQPPQQPLQQPTTAADGGATVADVSAVVIRQCSGGRAKSARPPTALAPVASPRTTTNICATATSTRPIRPTATARRQCRAQQRRPTWSLRRRSSRPWTSRSKVLRWRPCSSNSNRSSRRSYHISIATKVAAAGRTRRSWSLLAELDRPMSRSPSWRASVDLSAPICGLTVLYIILSI